MNIKKHITKFIMGDRIVLIKPENNYTNEDKAKVDSIDDLQKEVDDLQDIADNAEKNTIVTIKRNGTALTPDANRAVDIKVPTKMSELSNDMRYVQEIGSPTFDSVMTYIGISFNDMEYGEPSISGFYSYDDDSRGLMVYGYDSYNDEEYDPIIRGVGTPVADSDAANKAYVDSKAGGGGSESSPITRIFIDSYSNDPPDPVIIDGGYGYDGDEEQCVLDLSNNWGETVRIKNVENPNDDYDVANKKYVDAAIAKLQAQIDALKG